MNRRVLAFAVIVAACAAAVAFYAIRASRRGPSTNAPSVASTDVEQLEAVMREPHALFRNTMVADSYGYVAVVPLNRSDGVRYRAPLQCERVDSSGGTGVCLTANRDVLTTYSAIVFGPRFETLRTLPLGGIPSRVRVAPDGHLAGITVFVTGHAYSQTGFSTQTTIVDTQAGQALADLEQFAVARDGHPFKAQDFNFWGVTFARDSNTFYATLNTGGTMFLIKGDARARTAAVTGEGVECPSLSPDNRRIAFKRREISGGQLMWRLAVLDLATGAQRVLPNETRSVDDQVEWLDNRNILYSIPDPNHPGSTDVFVLDVDGGAPRTFAAAAYSPSVALPE
jgi:hypothetical protein